MAHQVMPCMIFTWVNQVMLSEHHSFYMLNSVRQDSLERVGKSVYLFKMVAYRMLMILHLCLILNYDHILCGSEFIYLNFLGPCLCAGSREVCLFI